MLLSLEEVKHYLRVDGDEENALITSFIETSQEICEEILRYPISEFEKVPLLVRQAMLYCIANMYENREVSNGNSGIEETINVMKTILSTYRKKSW